MKKRVQFIIDGGPFVVYVHVVVRQDVFSMNTAPGPRGAKHQVVGPSGSGAGQTGVMHRIVVPLLVVGGRRALMLQGKVAIDAQRRTERPLIFGTVILRGSAPAIQ